MSTKINTAGCLYIVATPIGNLNDMTLRAIETLKQVDLIAAEDTRHSGKLLQHYAIQTSLTPLHEHNEEQQCKKLVKQLEQGKQIALISDAGTPLISDPGFPLVRMARELNINVITIPGACALIAALSISGLATDRFTFEGFLPAKQAKRLQQLELLKEETRTMIFYESPHRLLNMFNDLNETFEKDRYVVVARELTKKFEEVYQNTLETMLEWLYKHQEKIKGEIVVLIEGAKLQKKKISGEAIRILTILLKECPIKQAVDLTVKITGEKRNQLYQQALSQKDE